ncbi:MAG: PAS domain-containing protein [Melioribacteraceae bacterium]|nr:PAS domain-containing protein [Melioribacteraceae bacterium]
MGNWQKEFNAAITVCNVNGKIIDMNDKAALTFKDDGGYDLVGKNLFECHSDSSSEIIKELISERQENIYTIEKNGIKKLIFQSPWYENGEMKGLVELSLEIPFEIPHHIR